MPISKKGTQKLDSRALEASLPTLTAKLRELNKTLTPDEQAVFSSIVNSASLHLESMETLGHTADIAFAKPISAVATVGVRKRLIKLPQALGLNK